MFTLQELCYQNIATSTMNAPPLIQEMIVGETTTIIEERVRGQLSREVTKEITEEVTVKVNVDVHQIYSDIVPEIVKDIVRATVNGGASRKNFVDIYSNIDPQIMRMAIEAAETIASTCVTERLATEQDDVWGYDSD
jgi:hypothetical protein